MPTSPTPADRPAAEPAPFRYVDEDGFCLSSRLLPDLTAGGTTSVVSITVEGSGEPQSAHVPVAELPKVLAGIAGSAALVVARQLLGTNVAEGASLPEPQDHPGADLFAALQHAGFDVDEANARMYAYARMVLRQENATAVPPAPADRAAGIAEAADFVRALLVSRPGITTAGLEAELRTLAADAAAGVQPPTTTEVDTPAPWLYRRFKGANWDQLDDDDRSYWEHQARAVRRAVARGGFKTPPAPPAAPAAPEEPQ